MMQMQSKHTYVLFSMRICAKNEAVLLRIALSTKQREPVTHGIHEKLLLSMALFAVVVFDGHTEINLKP